jgi:hypothetical protein
MRVRATYLMHQIEHAEYAHEPLEVIGYLRGQLNNVRGPLAQVEATPFNEVAA